MDLIERTGSVQTRHPWEEARLRFFEALLRRCGVAARVDSVLDVGAGDGWLARSMMESLPPTARVVYWDTGYSDTLLADPDFSPSDRFVFVRERPRDRFGLILALDVLEHVEEATEFMRVLVDNNLGAGGHAVVSVPAWPWLFSSHDLRLRHHRRYTPGAGRALLRAAGLEVVSSGGLFHTLLLPRALQKACEHLSAPASAPEELSSWRAPTLVTSAVLGVLRLDGLVSRAAAALGADLPGLSWWALCRKPSR